MASSPDVPTTMGALLIGAFFASLLSGIVILQALLYFATYRSDPRSIKLLVLGVWGLDTLHTAFIWAGMWGYLIGDYGDKNRIDHIPWSIALTVILTAIVTFFVHCFFAHRIFLLSKRNCLMVAPVLILALLRLVSASVSTWEMLHYHSYELFKIHAYWIFTLGLSLSSAVDVLITGLLFYLFQCSRPESGHINYLIDKLVLYTFETGTLTCVGTIVSMVCWVTMDYNLIFLGLHFVIGKFYANSLLVMLNTRQNIRQTRHTSSVERGPVLFLETRPTKPTASHYFAGPSSKGPTDLQITVQTSVQYDVDQKQERSIH